MTPQIYGRLRSDRLVINLTSRPFSMLAALLAVIGGTLNTAGYSVKEPPGLGGFGGGIVQAVGLWGLTGGLLLAIGLVLGDSVLGRRYERAACWLLAGMATATTVLYLAGGWDGADDAALTAPIALACGLRIRWLARHPLGEVCCD